MRTVEVERGKARLHVVEHGEGPALVCLHAGIADHRMWRGQQQAFGDRWRVVAYDRRGFGRTRCEPEPHDRVDDLIAVLDALRIDSAVLMGCSQGGRLALDAALAHPGRVRALVPVAGGISGAPQPESFGPQATARIAACEAAEQRGDLDAVNELEAQLWLDGPEQPAGRVGGALRQLFLEMNGIALRQAASAGDAIEPPSAWSRLHEIAVPTLALWGPLDFAHVNANMQRVAALVPGARQQEIGGCAHLPNLERPAAFDAAVGEFIDALPAG